MKYLKKKKTLEEWQNKMKMCFGLLFCVSVSSAAAKKQIRFVTTFNFTEKFWKTNSGEDYFLKTTFMHTDFNFCPGNLVRTEHRSYFNIFSSLKKNPYHYTQLMFISDGRNRKKKGCMYNKWIISQSLNALAGFKT